MRVLFRVLLIGVAIYLVVRYLFKIFLPPARREDVQGSPRRRGSIDRERITDASFKDISDK